VPIIEFQVKCHKCGTVLTGLDSAGTCPFCQRRIAETVDDRLLDVASGMVGVDLTCTTCAYNLRTMPFDSVCPECAAPVVNSLRVEELRFCDPKWLRSIRKGLDIVVASVIVSIVLGLFFGLFFVLRAARAGGAPPTFGMAVMIIPSLCMYALLVWGVYCMTVPKPGEPPDDRINRIGGAGRILVILATLVTLLTLFADDSVSTIATGSISLWRTIPGLLANLFVTAAAICVVITLGRIAVLARRPGLKKLGTWLCWLVGVQMVLGCVSGIVTFLVMPSMVAGLPGMPPPVATTTTVGPGGTTVSARYNLNPGASLQPGNAPINPAAGVAPTSTPAISPTAPPISPTGPFPTGAILMMTVFGCASGLVSLALLVLGVIALSRHRKLLTSAIAASVTASPSRVST